VNFYQSTVASEAVLGVFCPLHDQLGLCTRLASDVKRSITREQNTEQLTDRWGSPRPS
jgi:hypothetical protein